MIQHKNKLNLYLATPSRLVGEGSIYLLRNILMRIGYGLLLGFLLLNLASCESEYQQYIDEELASGEVQDSLMLGMRMGQTRKDFYKICWELNSQKIISQGTGSNARMEIDSDTSAGNYKKELLFYGIFDDQDTMRGMRMTYSYVAWAPWNRDKQADSLLLDLEKQYLKAYPGNDFIEVEVKQLAHPALVKIDGNRQILMYPKNDKDVAVKIEDLRFKYNK